MDEVLLYTFYPDEQEVRFFISDIYAPASKVKALILETMTITLITRNKTHF